jgi:shikimate dehydrogenase
MKHAAVIGHPISHSRSPALFAQFASASGVELQYDALDVQPDDLVATIEAWRADGDFVGCNVTLPHKERVLALADHVEAGALACGAANVLTRRHGGELVADNTDVAGVEAALRGAGVALRGARVAILGAGGAARAVAEAARRNGAASIAVAGRNAWRTGDVAAVFGAVACALDAVPIADVYVNATPVGMVGGEQASLLPADAPAGAAAFDLVYTPEWTPFLDDARARGLVTVTGTAMFVAQAAATFERWFGFAPVPLEGPAER